MKKPYLLDPKRANDPDVIAEYEADREQFRQHTNFSELDRLVQQAKEISRDLETARSRKQRARVTASVGLGWSKQRDRPSHRN